jgi:hypothetical protein
VARGGEVRPAAARGVAFARDADGLDPPAAFAFAVRAPVAAGFERAARRGGSPPGVAEGFGLAAARERARAGVSAGLSAAGDAGVARFALRRAGRVRGRLVRTSWSLPSPEESLGGMARFLPIGSPGAVRGPRHRPAGAVSAGASLATVASDGAPYAVSGKCHIMRDLRLSVTVGCRTCL